MKMRVPVLLLGLLLSIVSVRLLQAEPAKESARWWSDEVEQALSRAESNRQELVKALAAVPEAERKGMAFLIANMPEHDSKSLPADFLLENVELAYKARLQLPWGRGVPEDIFLNDVLAHANLDEARDPWRKQMYDLCLPLVKDCKTPGEAAQLLNSTLFGKLKVRYSTERKKANQSPKESIETGKASCSGLSILLTDACRSVAIPARLAGTAMWTNQRGNHTWVEIWDNGWHFTGAAEPDPKGLNRAWFAGDAAQAKAESRLHAIYAASFRKTDVSFPLVWAPERKDVYAENVTARYVKSGLSQEQSGQIEKAAQAYFAAKEAAREKWKFDASLDRLLGAHEDEVRRIVWKAYQKSPIHDGMKKDFDTKVVRHQQHVSAYTFKTVGKRPDKGWPLFIAMHGGGGVPKKVNDSQWEMMQDRYKDQSSVSGYQYLALRAPNDAWNGFYDGYVPPLVINLIRQFVLFGDINPDRVFLIGYSHGGYGAFYIGPKIPDRFAAIHSSAAAPSDGTVSAKNLRNTRFTFMIGEKDTAYGRAERCLAFNEVVQKLKEQNKGDYPVLMEFMKGLGHNLPDRDKFKDMLPHTRNPVPRRLTWELTDSVIRDFFWLTVPEAGGDRSIDAAIKDNAIDISTRNIKQFALELDSRLIALDKPLRITLNGKMQEAKAVPELLTLCRSLLERGDPALAFTCRIPLNGEKK